MINVSNEVLTKMQTNTGFLEYVRITLEDNTVLEIPQVDLVIQGNSITSGAGANSFPLGQASARTITVEIANFDDKYSEYDFYGARIMLTVKYPLSQGYESIPYGSYTVITPETRGTTIKISAVDDMYKADKPYETSITFPTTALHVWTDAATSCGIVLQTNTFTNSSFVIETPPENVSFRQVFGAVAMLAGGNCYINRDGRLEIKTYDLSVLEQWKAFDGGVFNPWEQIGTLNGGTFNPWNTGDAGDGGTFLEARTGCHILHAWLGMPKIDTDDIVITGLKAGDFAVGQEGYILQVENPLITGVEETALQAIGTIVIGLKFRAFSGDYIGDPTIEFMDPCLVIDRKGNSYGSFITDVNYQFRGRTSIKNSAEPKIRTKTSYDSMEIRALQKAKDFTKKEISSYDLGIQILSDFMAQSIGYYQTDVVEESGATVSYLHDKPLLEESTKVWKRTADGYASSSDGGVTWNAGWTYDGNAVFRHIAAQGISADWINTGAFSISKGGNEVFYADVDTGAVRIVADTFSLSNGKSIADIADDAVEAQTQTDIFNKLTNNGQLQGLYMQNGNLYMNASYIKSGILQVSKTVNGQVVNTLYANADTGVVNIVADTFSLSNGKTIQDLADEAVDSMTQEEVFDKLTNNGQLQGIYMENGDLYINASKIKSGILSISKTVEGRNVETLYVNADTGVVRVCADSFTLSSGEAIEDVAQDVLDEWIANNYGVDMSAIQTQLDAHIMQWFTDTVPTTGNYPASQWNNSEKPDHVDDMCYNKSTGKVYKFSRTVSGVKIKFTDDSRTQNASYDYVQIYFEKNSEIYALPKIGGTAISGAELFVPAVNFYLRFKTNASSNNYYGYKIASVTSASGEMTGTLSELPSSSYTTMSQGSYPESAHNPYGDSLDQLYYCRSGYTQYSDSYSWIEIQDKDITQALEDAANAQDTADGKRRVFTSQPTPPYDAGDLWVNATYTENGVTHTNEILRCKTSKAAGETFSISHWVKASKYTDDQALTDWIQGDYATNKADIEEQIDGKIDTFYNSSDPSTSWTTAEKAEHKHDLWYCTASTSNNPTYGQRTWRWNGSSWDEIKTNPPQAVFDRIDGKCSVYYSTPTTPYHTGDLFFNGTNIYVCTTARSSGSYSSSDWTKKDGYQTSSDVSTSITTAMNNYSPTQAKIFEALFKKPDGTWSQGYSLVNNELYINASMINSGYIHSDRIDANSINASKLNITDLSALNATIAKFSIVGNSTKHDYTSQGGHCFKNSLYSHGVSTRSISGVTFYEEFEVGLKADFSENDYVFYVRLTPPSSTKTSDISQWNAGSSGFYDNAYINKRGQAQFYDLTVGRGTGTPDHGIVECNEIKTIYSIADTGTTIVRNSSGYLRPQSASSKRYKDIISESVDIEKWYSLTPKTAKYKEGYLAEKSEWNGKAMPMLIAEEVDAICHEAAIHSEEGQVEDWNHRVIIPVHQQMLVEQHNEIERLKARIALLERRLTDADV